MRSLLLWGLVLLAVAATPVFGGTIVDVKVGTADVDGLVGEWDLAGVPASEFYVADMYNAGDPNDPVLSKLFLQYDPATQVLYSLVYTTNLAMDVLANRPDDAFAKQGQTTKLVDGNSGDDGTAPDFAWVGRSGDLAWGWEGSMVLAPGLYESVMDGLPNGGGQVKFDPDEGLNFHVQVLRDATSAVAYRRISVRLPDEPLTPPSGVAPVPGAAWAGLAMLGALALARRLRRRGA